MKIVLIQLLIFSLLTHSSIGQVDPKTTIDPIYGIQGYKSLVAYLEGDSIRTCEEKPCAGHVEDFYTSGQVLHKGFYLNGQLQSFKNFFPNGQIERKFGIVDENHCKLQVFYKSGAKKSEVKYGYGNVKEWVDYYENGNVEYEEKFDKSYEFVIFRDSYYENGNAQTTMKFENKKDHTYFKKEYHEDGTMAAEGLIHFFALIADYRKIDEWKVYNKGGKHIKTEAYVNGKLNEVKSVD
ncbi:MAG: hypothetical protein OSB25_02315 [Salibacteraceae bacterium]|nr:hypothetical protein [Salibacteraceae bacterium]|tara:strand:- start:20465 stop:21178 length:714 start_codon:yes stop_codon:yes gene_type:complete